MPIRKTYARDTRRPKEANSLYALVEQYKPRSFPSSSTPFIHLTSAFAFACTTSISLPFLAIFCWVLALSLSPLPLDRYDQSGPQRWLNGKRRRIRPYSRLQTELGQKYLWTCLDLCYIVDYLLKRIVSNSNEADDNPYLIWKRITNPVLEDKRNLQLVQDGPLQVQILYNETHGRVKRNARDLTRVISSGSYYKGREYDLKAVDTKMDNGHF